MLVGLLAVTMYTVFSCMTCLLPKALTESWSWAFLFLTHPFFGMLAVAA
jgi:hypothetical protein